MIDPVEARNLILDALDLFKRPLRPSVFLDLFTADDKERRVMQSAIRTLIDEGWIDIDLQWCIVRVNKDARRGQGGNRG